LHTIKEHLSQAVEEKVLDAQTFLAWVLDANTAYRELSRPGQDAQDIVDLKLRVSFWRSQLLNRILSQPPAWLTEEQDATLQILLAINAYLHPAQQKLAAELLGPDLMAQLLASQGIASSEHPHLDQLAGPSVDLDIVANRGSSSPYEEWRENDAFSRYQFEDEGLRYRGISFRPGDVLLANVNVDGNGVYTSLSEPRSFSSHSGFLAIFEHDGKRIPVVVETYEKGVRPVPLSIFLGPRFCSYVEVYRHTDYTSEHAAGNNESGARFIDSVLAYNFSTEDPDPDYMSCTTVGRFMHKAANLKPADRISEVSHPQIQSNLATIGYHHSDYFGPVDFLLNECFYFAGVIDNNQVEHLVARELIDQEFNRKFKSSTLNSRKFPFPYRLNLWGLRHMRRQTLVGRIVSSLEGFTTATLPKGPDELLAVILLLEKQIGKAIVKTKVTVDEVLADLDHLDMAALANDPRIQNAIGQNLQLPWLKPL